MLVHPLTLSEVLVGGVRVGRGMAMRDDLDAAGIRVAADAGEPLRVAELRTSTGLKLPDCCVLGVALRSAVSLATFDEALAAAAPQRGVRLLP
jgi:predicted nucleic acid-binding protein